MKGEGCRKRKDDEKGEGGEEGCEKGGKAEVEEKEVVQKEAMGGVPGVMLEEIRGKRGGKVAVVNPDDVA